MQDFPVTPPISLDAAIERIKDFCNSQLPAEEFAEALKKLPQQAVEAFFQEIPAELHKQLFSGIPSNAGEYRKATDSNKEALDLIRIRGAESIFLPPYRPELNPIECLLVGNEKHYKKN